MMNTYNGQDPCHIRLQSVSGNSFSYQIEEWNKPYDGWHTNEDIAFIAIEAGTYLIDGNLRLTAQTYTGDHTWKNVQFSNAFTDVPVVLSQCQTRNGGQAVDTREQLITKTGLQVRLQEEEGNDGLHVIETVGVVSIGAK